MPAPRGPDRRGVTLLELLIVIGIIMLLAGVAIPTMQPALEGRRIREAARAINVYCGAARNRALETGRPCGVVIRRFKNKPDCAMILEQAEEPPSYAGESMFSVANVDPSSLVVNNNIATLTANFPDIVTTKVSEGDLVQFNGQGPLYEITVVAGTNLTMKIDVSGGLLLPWFQPGAPPAVPYVIHRRPTLSMANPLQLPATTVIDLRYSGTDDYPQAFESAGPIVEDICIMFAPSGSISRVYWGGDSGTLTQPIHLLVGRYEQMDKAPAAANAEDEDKANYQILTNLWVTINPQTGLVTCTEMAAGGQTNDALWDSRRFAREAQTMGGN